MTTEKGYYVTPRTAQKIKQWLDKDIAVGGDRGGVSEAPLQRYVQHAQFTGAGAGVTAYYNQDSATWITGDAVLMFGANGETLTTGNYYLGYCVGYDPSTGNPVIIVDASPPALAYTSSITYVDQVCSSGGLLTFTTSGGNVTDILLNGNSVLATGVQIVSTVTQEQTMATMPSGITTGTPICSITNETPCCNQMTSDCASVGDCKISNILYANFSGATGGCVDHSSFPARLTLTWNGSAWVSEHPQYGCLYNDACVLRYEADNRVCETRDYVPCFDFICCCCATLICPISEQCSPFLLDFGTITTGTNDCCCSFQAGTIDVTITDV